MAGVVTVLTVVTPKEILQNAYLLHWLEGHKIDFETEKFHRKWAWGNAKTFKSFLCQNYEAFEVPTRAVFRPLI